jgi:hypothetical protein
MKLLAIGRLRQGADAYQIALRTHDEMRALWQLYRDGIVREMYSPGGPGSVLVIEATARQEAEAILASLPLAADGVIDFELIELRPFSGLEVLFAGQPPAPDRGQGPGLA